MIAAIKLMPWHSRSLALALLLVTAAGLFMAVAGPLLSLHQRYRDSIEQSEDRLMRYKRIVAYKGALQQRLSIMQSRTASQDFYLRNTNPSLAAADLQEQVKQIIATNGGTLLSTQIMPEHQEGQLMQITVKVAMRGGIETMQKVFYTLESGRPFLFLDDVYVRAYSLRRGNQMTVSEMEIRFDLSGYIRAGT
jgi:general secretion pathway protein M